MSTRSVTKPVIKQKGFISEDQAKIREKILTQSLQTRAQLWFILCALQASREVAKQQNRQDWREQINTWIDRLGAMYNSLFYLQANVYEFGLDTDKMKLRDLQKELRNVNAIRTDQLFIKCLQQMPNALNAPANTIEEEITLYAAQNKTVQIEGLDPWD